MEITAAIVSEKGSNFKLTEVTLGEPRIDEVLVKIVATEIPTGELVCIGVARKPLELETNIFLTKGYKIKWINQGDSVPQEFIPKLINMYKGGQFPFDRLIKKYDFEDINGAIEDSEKGKTIKAVLLIGNYNN
jgi:aryl-alcohol dehydrogenase